MSQIIITNGKVGVFSEIKTIKGHIYDNPEAKLLTPEGLRDFVEGLIVERSDWYEGNFMMTVASNLPIYYDGEIYSWEKSGVVLTFNPKTLGVMKDLVKKVSRSKHVNLLIPVFNEKEKSVLLACMCERGCASDLDRQYMSWLRHLLEL